MMTYHNYEKFNLHLLSEEDSTSELRFNKRDIYILIDHFETSEEIRCCSRITFDKEALYAFKKIYIFLQVPVSFV